MKTLTDKDILNGVLTPGIFDDLLPETTDQFYNWVTDNCHVVRAFYERACELFEKGNRQFYSAYCIREKLRWDSMIGEVGTEYKISNNVTPHLARLTMVLDPRLSGMFKLKTTN